MTETVTGWLVVHCSVLTGLDWCRVSVSSFQGQRDADFLERMMLFMTRTGTCLKMGPSFTVAQVK